MLEEVIVTATRRPESLMEIPQSIQAIPDTVLASPNFNDMSDVFNLVPGAVQHSAKPPDFEGIQLRGSGITQSNADDGRSPVGYYVDDIPYVDISTPVPPPISTFDLERVEILRGPQGTSYGQDSTGGSVILRTKPVDLANFGDMVRLGFSKVSSSHGQGSTFGGVLNVPLVKDKFGFRFSYLREEDPGYGKVQGRPDIENPLENVRHSARLKVHAVPSDRFDLVLTHSEWQTNYNFLPGSQIADNTGGHMVLAPVTEEILLARFPDGQLENDYDVRWTTLLATLDFGFADLTWSAGLVDTPKKETNARTVFFSPSFGGEILSGNFFNQPAESRTQELRMVSTTEGPIQWLAGLFFLSAESDATGWSETPAFFYREFTSDPIETDVRAVYGEVEYEFLEDFSAQLGLRYHDEDRKNSFFQNGGLFSDPLFGPYTLVTSASEEKNSFDHLSYRATVSWRKGEEGLVYLTQSTAARAPILLFGDEAVQLEASGIEPIGPDESLLVNTEIGAKWTLDLGGLGELQLEGAYARGDWQSIPLWGSLNIGMDSPVSYPIGDTGALITSYEITAVWAIFDGLTVGYAGAYTDTEVTDVPDDAALVPDDGNPETIPGYPRVIEEGGKLFHYSPWTHNLNLEYSRATKGGWEMTVTANYVLRERVDGLNVFDLRATEYFEARDGFQNLSLGLGFERGPWGLNFSVNNALDEDGAYRAGSKRDTYTLIQRPASYAFQVTWDGFAQ